MLQAAPTTYQAGRRTGCREVLYNFASAANNNGSAFACQGTGTQWYTMTQGIAMLIGRFFLIIPALADRRLAGRQAEGAGHRPARCRRTRRCSACLVVGVDRRSSPA